MTTNVALVDARDMGVESSDSDVMGRSHLGRSPPRAIQGGSDDGPLAADPEMPGASMSANDKVLSGSIAKLYETHLVPLIFEPYAADLKQRVGLTNVSRILELAAGTGVVTRALASLVNERLSIVARI